jgi:CBS domain-containing protein
MPGNIPVRDVMTTEVVTFRPDDPIGDAMRRLVERGIDGAPVVDSSGSVVGMLTSDDLIVQDSRLHFPTVVTILGAELVWPSSQKHFEEELHKAVGLTVGEVMHDEVVTCTPDDSVESAATMLHERHVSRLPVVEGGRLVGIISRGDILEAIVRSAGQDG